jgi:hypothetical protein
MLQLLQSLTPDQQAALVGLLIAGGVYVGRHVAPGWFAGQEAAAKFQRTAGVVLLAGLGVLIKTAATGWPGAGAYLLAWALAYATAEGAHTVVARTSALGE